MVPARIMQRSIVSLTLMGVICGLIAPPRTFGADADLAAPEGNVIPGNCDGDQDVDLLDFYIFSACLTGPRDGVLPGQCDCVNADGDTDVDLADWAEFQRGFTGSLISANVLELAGNSLAAYPFFEYVSAFNQGSSIEIAVDPTRFSSITGKSCDLYVTTARSAEEWNADRELIDVRAGGPQAVAFAGASIQENTVAIEQAAALNGDAGMDVGVGYDVVLDCDTDGLLGEDDYVDGFGGPAGLYVIDDLTTSGPLATSFDDYELIVATGEASRQRLFYPTDIAVLGPRPLVVIGHGGGMDYDYYDYLQDHLASYGYIVMSHEQTDEVEGVILHSDAIIDQQATIAGGALNGLIDTHRITWIGHSFGGRNVINSYHRVVSGEYSPAHFNADDIAFISTIAPNAWTEPIEGEVGFLLLYGSADGDRTGEPWADIYEPFRVYERAIGEKTSIYVHGADHHDFNCCGRDDFRGPPGTAIGREEAQQIAKAVYLAAIKHFVEGNIPASDYFWRQWERFRPVGVAATSTVVCEYQEGPSAGRSVIDDHEGEPSTAVSSSGGAITSDVSNVFEGVLTDGDDLFEWSQSDQMNGMTRAGETTSGDFDTYSGVVFDWSADAGPYFYELQVVPADRDFSDNTWLSFRACQGTRHPETVAVLEDLTFTVTLRDGSGTTSSINFAAYGGGIEEPYQRTGAGVGAGWQNEFETIRIRLTDFLTNGSDLNLANVTAIRFEFGEPFGSDRGRIGLDDVQVK